MDQQLIYLIIQAVILIGSYIIGKYIMPRLSQGDLSMLTYITKWVEQFVKEASTFIEDFKAWINGREGEQYEEKEIIDYGWELIAQDVGYPNGNKTYYDYYKIDVDGITYKLEVAWNSFNETIVGNKIWEENENV